MNSSQELGWEPSSKDSRREKMKIWMEALTGKQALLFHFLGVELEKQGHELLYTARNYDYVLGNFDRLGRTVHSFGKYGGASLYDKLISSSERIIQLARLVRDEKPDLLLSFSSPDAARVAFGLGIRTILMNDTPHATAAARLTMSLSEALVHPSSIDPSVFKEFGARRFFPFDGVDEVLWTRNFSPDTAVLDQLGIQKDRYLVVRCEESKAAYFQEMYPGIKPGSTIIPDILNRLREQSIALPIVAFPRYEEQVHALSDLEGVIVPETSVDTMSLLYYSRVSMTGGGTMGREGALLGTPTIYSFPRKLEVSSFTSEKGFPLYHCPNHLEVTDYIVRLLSESRLPESRRLALLESMETPMDGIKRAFAEMELR